jgi:hypothetical protein
VPAAALGSGARLGQLGGLPAGTKGSSGATAAAIEQAEALERLAQLGLGIERNVAVARACFPGTPGFGSTRSRS